MAAMAIPAALGAGQLGLGLLANRQAGQQAQQAQRQYQAAAQPVRQTAGQLTGMGTNLFQNYGLPYFGQGAGYFSKLLGAGGRNAMQAAVAPAAANITELTEGAKRSIAPGDRSGTAALQRAELDRQKVGQIGRLTAGVQ